MAHNQHGTPLQELGAHRGPLPPPGCLRVFIQRDYSQGTCVKFSARFPQELEGRIEQARFEQTIAGINGLYTEAEEMSCARYCEGCLGCMTAYFLFFFVETHYEQIMKKISKYIAEQNETVYIPRGLFITNPIERGLRVIEVSILNEPAPTRAS